MFFIGAIALIGVLVGAGLGSFFWVFVLIPVALASLIVAVSVSPAYEYDFQSAVVSTIAVLIGPQIGYLAAAGIQWLFKAVRTSSPRVNKPTVGVPLTRPAE